MSDMIHQPIAPFIEQFLTTILGTIASNGYPFSSYAPFYYDGAKIYLFLSDIATHAQNIQATPKVSCMFIEDESKSSNLFARKRITMQCDAKIISRDDTHYTQIIEAFQKRHPTIEMLSSMQDFRLYSLTPFYGEATFGFGEAYRIGGEKMNLFVPRDNPGGHQ